MAIVNKNSFVLAQRSQKRGPLVRVEISPGRFVKMYREDAIAAGHIKAHPPADAERKMRLPAENKALRHSQGSQDVAGEQVGLHPPSIPPAGGEESAVSPKPDDFTTIHGVGRATARALQARGITTFEQLRQAGTLDYVSAQAMQAIEMWRQGGTG